MNNPSIATVYFCQPRSELSIYYYYITTTIYRLLHELCYVDYAILIVCLKYFSCYRMDEVVAVQMIDSKTTISVPIDDIKMKVPDIARNVTFSVQHCRLAGIKPVSIKNPIFELGKNK